MINYLALDHLEKALPPGEFVLLKASVENVDKIEKQYLAKVEAYYRKINQRIAKEMVKTGKMPKMGDLDLNFLPLIIDHAHAVIKNAIKTTKLDPLAEKKIPKAKLGGRPKKIKIPTSMEELRKLYDQWKKKRNLTPLQKQQMKDLQQAYLKKLEQVYKKYNKPLKVGDSLPAEELISKIAKALETTKTRAETIVRTETTNYYNTVRRNIYDEVPGVTHYLFICIRDHRTTPWCKSRNDLVYTKGSKVLDEETPPIHYNCRSEILPLSKYNPSHLRIIENYTARNDASPAPLPTGWVRENRSRHK